MKTFLIKCAFDFRVDTDIWAFDYHQYSKPLLIGVVEADSEKEAYDKIDLRKPTPGYYSRFATGVCIALEESTKVEDGLTKVHTREKLMELLAAQKARMRP